MSYSSPLRGFLCSLAIVIFASIPLAITGCATDCADLRAEAKPLIEGWQTCSADEACVIVASSTGDCSGTFTCGVAVRASVQAEAKAKAEEIAEEARGCSMCIHDDCAPRTSAVCESGRCVAKP